MSFNLKPKQTPIAITIDTLTPQMINDLIVFYAYDPESIDPLDIQMNHLIYERTGIVMDYPRINKEVVELFYKQLDIVKTVIKDIIVQNFHTGEKAIYFDINENVWRYLNSNGSLDGIADQTDIDAWVVGSTPTTIDELKYWLYFIIKRDFYEQGSWIYNFSAGDFEQLKPFLEYIVDLIIMQTTEGDYDLLVTYVKETNPFIQN